MSLPLLLLVEGEVVVLGMDCKHYSTMKEERGERGREGGRREGEREGKREREEWGA